jgi:hypothetical protein
MHPVKRCYSAAAATAVVKQALQRNGFTGWQVVVRPFPGQSCAASALPDSSNHTVLILGF